MIYKLAQLEELDLDQEELIVPDDPSLEDEIEYDEELQKLIDQVTHGIDVE